MLQVADLEGGSRLPPPFGDGVTSSLTVYIDNVLYNDTIASLPLQTRKTWYSEYSKWFLQVAFWQL